MAKGELSEATLTKQPDGILTMEGAISVAVVKADMAPVVDGAREGINLAAAALTLVNPSAGIAVLTASVLGGWIWNRWKYDRVRPALAAIGERLQNVESEYVRRQEFADLLDETLRKMAEQPDDGRREAMFSTLNALMVRPRDHITNRKLIRLIDELPPAVWDLLRIAGALGDGTWTDAEGTWTRVLEVTGWPNLAIHDVLEYLVGEHLVSSTGIWGLATPMTEPRAYSFRLTDLATDLLVCMQSR